jgi:hypothetical protein
MRRLWIVAAVIALASPAAAQIFDQTYLDNKGLSDRFTLNIGSFITTISTNAEASGDAGGEEVDLEDDLGLRPDIGEFRLSAEWRLARKHALTFGYWGTRRDAETTLEEDIEWDDVIYPVSATLRTESAFDSLKLGYRYSFVNNGTVDFGASIGFSVLQFKFALEGEAEIIGPGGPIGTEQRREEEDLIAPVPVVGLNVEWALRPRLFLRGGLEYFKANYEEYTGELLDGIVGLDWFPWKHVGFGAAYNYVTVQLTKEGGVLEEFSVDYNYDGVFAYLRLAY